MKMAPLPPATSTVAPLVFFLIIHFCSSTYPKAPNPSRKYANSAPSLRDTLPFLPNFRAPILHVVINIHFYFSPHYFPFVPYLQRTCPQTTHPNKLNRPVLKNHLHIFIAQFIYFFAFFKLKTACLSLHYFTLSVSFTQHHLLLPLLWSPVPQNSFPFYILPFLCFCYSTSVPLNRLCLITLVTTDTYRSQRWTISPSSSQSHSLPHSFPVSSWTSLGLFAMTALFSPHRIPSYLLFHIRLL